MAQLPSIYSSVRILSLRIETPCPSCSTPLTVILPNHQITLVRCTHCSNKFSIHLDNLTITFMRGLDVQADTDDKGAEHAGIEAVQ